MGKVGRSAEVDGTKSGHLLSGYARVRLPCCYTATAPSVFWPAGTGDLPGSHMFRVTQYVIRFSGGNRHIPIAPDSQILSIRELVAARKAHSVSAFVKLVELAFFDAAAWRRYLTTRCWKVRAGCCDKRSGRHEANRS